MKFFDWLFTNSTFIQNESAKDRMQKMLMQDRLELPAGQLESMQDELMKVVANYFEMDGNCTNFQLSHLERKAQFSANFLLVRSK